MRCSRGPARSRMAKVHGRARRLNPRRAARQARAQARPKVEGRFRLRVRPKARPRHRHRVHPPMINLQKFRQVLGTEKLALRKATPRNCAPCVASTAPFPTRNATNPISRGLSLRSLTINSFPRRIPMQHALLPTMRRPAALALCALLSLAFVGCASEEPAAQATSMRFRFRTARGSRS